MRIADIGDAVSEDSHNLIWGRNLKGAPQVVTLADGRQINSLGTNSGMAADQNPELKAENTHSASEPMLKLVQQIFDLYRYETNHPAVADGEDQGSQDLL